MFSSFFRPRGQEAVDGAFSGEPLQGFWPKWFGGILVPMSMAAFGGFSVWTERSFLLGKLGWLTPTLWVVSRPD